MRDTGIGMGNRLNALEDEIYLQMDKLLALCGMQCIADGNECEVPLGLRTNYSVVLEEQALALRKLLDQAFG